jgi:hypothetical protein
MNAHATLTPDPAPYGADAFTPEGVVRARALAGRQLNLLERLAEAGMQVVLAVEREAKARSPEPGSPQAPPQDQAAEAAPSTPPPEARAGRALQALAMAYARAARAVRLTVAVQSRVLRELERVERQGEFNAPAEARRRREARHEASQARKASIQRIVRRVAEGEGEGAERIEALVEDAAERLDDADVYGDVLTRPMGEIIARICADLGLRPDWEGLAHEAWADAEAATAAPGSPFAARGLGDLHRQGLNVSAAPRWAFEAPQEACLGDSS